MTKTPKEAWSLDRFVAAYDAVALRKKGWAFERTPENERYAEREYGRGSCRSLAEFAEERFRLDQVDGAL
jgi:hypothetical protein